MADRVGMVARALACLGSRADIILGRRSSMYESEPWGDTGQGDFVNAVCEVDTHLEPIELLSTLKAIEGALGRRPRRRWGPREIDLDILFYGDRVVEKEDLKIPHPQVCKRIFVLEPLVEIVPDMIHPETGLRVCDHLAEMKCSGEDLRCQNLDI